MDAARVFLHRVLPWPPLGDPNAYFNIHWTFQKKNYNRPGFGGRACKSVDEMIKAVQFAQKGKDTLDIYVCMSSQRMAEAKQAASGFTYLQALRSQEQVCQLRSLFIDIDVKEGAYPTTADAIVGLRDFLASSGIPRPTLMVASGSGGMHVYWVLDRGVSLNEWQPMADALVEATRQHGLKCDTGCTIDAARVLRVPDTFNKKSTPPKPVTLGLNSVLPTDYTVEQMQAVLSPFAQAATPTLPQRARTSVNDELSAGIEQRQSRPVILDTVAEGCGFIREAINTGGASYDNPLWHLTTLVSVFAEDGQAQAHRMAKGHPSYSPKETEELYDRKVKDRDSRNLGWPSCKAIRDAGCASCATCPHFAAGKSPLHLGRTATLPFAAEPDLPQRYMRDEKGRVIFLQPVGDGTVRHVPVSPYPMMKAWLQSDPWTLHFVTSLGNGVRETQISIPFDVNTSLTLGKWLGRQGFAVTGNDIKNLQEFFVAWIKKLQDTKDALVKSTPFGWLVVDGTMQGFSYAGHVWGKGDPKPATSSDPAISRRYAPHGELSVWQEAANMITDQKRPELDIILAMAFGAPLVRFTGQSGVLLSAYSPESGVGKSTALKVAQAVWGHPVEGVQAVTDTQNSVVSKLNQLKNLPAFWDELGVVDRGGQFIEFLFRLTQGKEKSRLTADQTQRDPGSWQTALVAASNNGLLGQVAYNTKTTTAGLYRVFEFVVPPVASSLETGFVSRLTGRLSENFGQAGLIYAKFLGERPEDIVKFVASIQDSLSKKLNSSNDERFWISAMTCAYAGAHYANHLNLTQIDLKALLRFMMDALGTLRDMRKYTTSDVNNTDSLASILTQFRGEMWAHNTLVTDWAPGGAGKPKTCKLNSDVTRLGKINVRIGEAVGLMLISNAALNDWLHKAGYEPSAVVNAMKRHWGATTIKATLGAGTSVASGREYALKIDMLSPAFAGGTDHHDTIDEGPNSTETG